MPIYEYECAKCREKFEIFLEIGKEDIDLKCPKCHAHNPKRVLSSFNSGSKESIGKGCSTTGTT